MRCSGFSTRAMGRRQSEASPVKRASISWPAMTPSISLEPVPELPKSRSADGRLQSADALAGHLHRTVDVADSAPSAATALCRGQDILGLEQAGDAGATSGQRAQNQRAMGDRLVAGYPDRAGKGPRGNCGKWLRHGPWIFESLGRSR